MSASRSHEIKTSYCANMLQFLSENILLLVIMVIAAGGLILPSLTARRYGPQVGVTMAVTLINKQKALVVDVRESKDFRRGSIAGAVNMPAADMQSRMTTLPKDRPILLVDQTGLASRAVSKMLRNAGFENVFILDGGLAGWQNEKMPLTK